MNEQDDKYSGVPGLRLMNDIWEENNESLILVSHRYIPLQF